MADELQPNYDPTSYAFQEGALGQVPTFFRIAQFRVYGGTGVPSVSIGANNDYYLRADGVAGASTTLYHKEANIWNACTL